MILLVDPAVVAVCIDIYEIINELKVLQNICLNDIFQVLAKECTRYAIHFQIQSVKPVSLVSTIAIFKTILVFVKH